MKSTWSLAIALSLLAVVTGCVSPSKNGPEPDQRFQSRFKSQASATASEPGWIVDDGDRWSEKEEQQQVERAFKADAERRRDTFVDYGSSAMNLVVHVVDKDGKPIPSATMDARFYGFEDPERKGIPATSDGRISLSVPGYFGPLRIGFYVVKAKGYRPRMLRNAGVFRERDIRVAKNADAEPESYTCHRLIVMEDDREEPPPGRPSIPNELTLVPVIPGYLCGVKCSDDITGFIRRMLFCKGRIGNLDGSGSLYESALVGQFGTGTIEYELLIDVTDASSPGGAGRLEPIPNATMRVDQYRWVTEGALLDVKSELHTIPPDGKLAYSLPRGELPVAMILVVQADGYEPQLIPNWRPESLENYSAEAVGEGQAQQIKVTCRRHVALMKASPRQ